MPVGPAKLLPIVALLVGGMAGAQPALDQTRDFPPHSLTPAEVDALVEELNSDDVATRLNADAMLMTAMAPLRELERCLLRDDLTAEQRMRLTAAAYVAFTTESRAAMGVQFSPSPDQHSILLIYTDPKFDVHSKLRVGDRVQAMDGVRLQDIEHAIAIIQSHSPGDEVAVGVERNGQLLDLKVVLGSRDALPSANAVKDRAWIIRSAAYAPRLREEAVIDSGLAPDAWHGPVEARSPAVFVVAGGEARTLDSRMPRPLEPRTRRDGVRLQGQVHQVDVARDQQVLSQRRQERRDLEPVARNVQERLLNPTLNERQRAVLERQQATINLRIQALTIEIEHLESVLRRR
jgi:hypothetical protein